jgi:hypothetical protein
MSERSEGPTRLRETGGAEPRAAGPRAAPAASEGRQPFERARHALAEWLSHLIVVAGLLLGFHGVEAALDFIGQRLSFAGPALTSLFDAGDAGLIIGFLVYGVYSVLNAYAAEPLTGLDDAAPADRPGKLASAVRLALRPAAPSFTIAIFAERLLGHLLVYAVVLVAAVYICLLSFAPWPVSIGSLGLVVLTGIISAAVSAPRGFSGKLRWLVENRVAAGWFVMIFAVLLLIEELLRRSE